MKSITRTALLTLALACAGCATITGRPFDSHAASHFEDGKTTQAQVRAALGEPETQQTRDDGSVMWIYSSSRSASDWKTFVPFAALSAHGSQQVQALNLVFDKRGVLESHTALQSR